MKTDTRIIASAIFFSLAMIGLWKSSQTAVDSSKNNPHRIQNFLAKGYAGKYASQIIENQKKYTPFKHSNKEWFQFEKNLTTCIEGKLSEWISTTNSNDSKDVTTQEPTREVIGPVIKPCEDEIEREINTRK